MTDLSNWAPFTILVGPADVYVAETGAAFPTVSTAPPVAWTFIGKTEGGVTVRHPQTVNQITADQHTGPLKAVRTEEGLEVEFGIVDMTLENYSLALNRATVGTDAGPPASKNLHFHQGVNVQLSSLLIRGRSPYGNFPAQYQVPVCYQSESPEVTHVKDDKSVLSTVWTALEDLSAAADRERFGKLVAATA